MPTAVMMRRARLMIASSMKLAQPGEGVRQILHQVGGILETDVQAHQIVRGRLRYGSRRMHGHGQALVAAPAEANPKQLETIDECIRIAVELERKQSR